MSLSFTLCNPRKFYYSTFGFSFRFFMFFFLFIMSFNTIRSIRLRSPPPFSYILLHRCHIVRYR